MAEKKYNDTRELQSSNTKVDTPIQRADGTGTVTWVDFIDFRKVEEFGYGTNIQSIGGTWLEVLERLESLFKDLDSRIKALDTKVNMYHGDADSSIIGSGNFGTANVISLQTVLNCNWTLTSGSNYFTVSPTTGKIVEINYTGGTNPFGKGTIRCENDNSSIAITGSGSTISYSYVAGTPNTVGGTVKATNINNSSDFHTLDISKPSPYQSAGTWTFEFNTSKFQRTDSNSNGSITLKPINTSESTTDTLVCKNSNASNTVTKTITYTAAVQTYTVSLSVTNGTKSPNSSQTVNRGDSVSWTITPNTGYQMPSSVTGGTISGNTVTFNNITADKSFAITCVQQTFEVSLSITNGTKSPNSSQTVVYGGSVSWTITPNSGYQMPTSVTGGTISGNTVTFKNITTNKQFSLTCTQPATQYYFSYGVNPITASNYTTVNNAQQVTSYPSEVEYTPASRSYLYILVAASKTVTVIDASLNSPAYITEDTTTVSGYKIVKPNSKIGGKVYIRIS